MSILICNTIQHWANTRNMLNKGFGTMLFIHSKLLHKRNKQNWIKLFSQSMIIHLSAAASESQPISVILLLFYSQPINNSLPWVTMPLKFSPSTTCPAQGPSFSSWINPFAATECSPIFKCFHASQQSYVRSAVFFIWRNHAQQT